LTCVRRCALRRRLRDDSGNLIGDDLDDELDLLSRAMFQFRPQSSRFSVAFAVNAMWRVPWKFVVSPMCSTSKLSVRVMSRIVSSAGTR